MNCTWVVIAPYRLAPFDVVIEKILGLLTWLCSLCTSLFPTTSPCCSQISHGLSWCGLFWCTELEIQRVFSSLDVFVYTFWKKKSFEWFHCWVPLPHFLCSFFSYYLKNAPPWRGLWFFYSLLFPIVLFSLLLCFLRIFLIQPSNFICHAIMLNLKLSSTKNP